MNSEGGGIVEGGGDKVGVGGGDWIGSGGELTGGGVEID